AIYGLLGAVFAQGGDLAASALKRHVGIKDFGQLIPGHGGILDRFDSILFVAPFALVFFYIIT
ncbi:MAG: phosphatidate cytidylyltransferase, partial [Defluviitaleaceae bacterium]|nr:phosphatidate cytidylyltransferase [Defluviitaleaceae bacterium]